MTTALIGIPSSGHRARPAVPGNLGAITSGEIPWPTGTGRLGEISSGEGGAHGHTVTSTGGVTISGTATVAFHAGTPPGHLGVITSGEIPWPTGTGRLGEITSGESVPQSYVVTSTGGVTVYGAATVSTNISRSYAITSTGGVTISGTAVVMARHRIRAAHATVWSLRSGCEWSAAWNLNIRVQAAHSGVWSLRAGVESAFVYGCAPRILTAHAAIWGCLPIIRAAHDAIWGCLPVIRATHTTVWGCLPVIRATHAAVWGCLPIICTTHATAWGCTAAIKSAHVALWGATVPMRSSQSVAWSIRDEAMRGAWSATWSCSERVALRSSHVFAWSLVGTAATISPPSWSLICDGVPLAAIKVSILQSRDAGAWQMSATVKGGVSDFAPGAEVVLTLGVQSWQLALTEISADRADTTDQTCTLRAASKIATWNSAAIATRADIALPHGGIASALAASISSATPLVWQLPDWYITPIMSATLGASSAADALRALARAAGGMLVSQPDGTQVARPFSGSHLGAVSAIEASLVRDPLAVSGIEMRSHSVSDTIAVDGDGNTRTVRVTPQPWRDVVPRIAGGGATLTAPTVSTQTVTGEVQPLIAGIGTASRPVQRIVSATFSDGISRALHFRPGEPGIWLDMPLDTVVTLSFESRAIEATIATSTRQPINIIVEDTNP